MIAALKQLAMSFLPKVIKLGKSAGAFNKAVIARAKPFVVSGISKGSSKVANIVKNPKVASAIKTGAAVLSKDAILTPILSDVLWKAEKAVVKKVPLIGKPVGQIMDMGDTIIGIPLV